jgi:hypothetical protein
MKNLNPILRQPIDTIVDAKLFIRTLVSEGLEWHFEDCPIDCLHKTTQHISRKDAELLSCQRDSLYKFNWGAYECPIGFALHAFDPKIYPALD